MRCLILLAVCVVLANASYMNKNRFHKLLNRYTNRYDLDDSRSQYGSDLYGSDDVDDHVDDYVDEIRRERMLERDQCPRDIDNILGGYSDDDDEYDTTEFDDQYRGRRERYSNDDEMQRGRVDMDDEYRGRSSSRRYSNDDEMQHDRTDMDDENVRGRWSLNEEDESEFGSPLLKEVADANCKLATRLYKESKEERDDKNIVVSPLSIQLALAALNYGTRGTTKRQIGRVIGGGLQKHERRQVFRSLVRRLKGLRGNDYSTLGRKSQIKPVTGIFVVKTTPAQQNFVQMLRNTVGTTVKTCNFHRQPQECRQMINRWMTQKTQQKLTRIVPQDAITDNTKMILVNSMTVKATWGPQMRKHVTKEAKFYPLDTKKVKIVEVMETEGRFKYHEDELVKIVGIPTEQKELTLYVIVPKDKDGLTEVEKLHLQDSVQLKQLLEITDRRVRRVGVQLPKFQIKHKIDVRRTLRKQGVTDAFDPLRADFSGITGVGRYEQDENEDTFNSRRHSRSFETMEDEMTGRYETGTTETKLHLNKFIHQSTIKITENGITANSGDHFEDEQYEQRSRFGRSGGFHGEELNTFDEISGFNRREPTGQKIVKANRAFAFVLKHNPTNQLVFVGRVIDAAQKKVNNVQQTINVVDQM
jgi:serpin B